MRKSLLFLILLSAGAIEATRLQCVCNDKSAIVPPCGICGVELGTMEKTKHGVACICVNGLKNNEIACKDVCNNNRGWSGKIQEAD